MTQQNLEKIRELFLKARDLPPAARAAFLKTGCGEDADLRIEIDELLNADAGGDATGYQFNVPEFAHAPLASAVNIPRYQVHRILGDGGQGIVYLATQQSTGRRVAIKVLKALNHGSERVRARFDREVQILATLEHPNIVSIIDRGELPDGSPFLAMDFVNGISLAQWITSRSADVHDPSQRAKGLLMFIMICDAINVAHLQGITHRDLKPGNILIDERDSPHIVDFGLAHVLMQTDGSENAPLSAISMTGQFMGSLPWASPEQANGQIEKIDARSDVYSLGVLLYQLVTGGRFPYEVAGTMREVLDNILTAKPPPPSTVVARQANRKSKGRRVGRATGINRELDSIVLKALAKRRTDRYQSAGELGRDLENYLAGKPGSAASDERTKAHRKTMQLAAAILFGTMLAAGTTYWISKERSATSQPSLPNLAPRAALGSHGAEAAFPEPILRWSFDDPTAISRAVLGGKTIDAGADGVNPIPGKLGGAAQIRRGGYINLADRPQFHLTTAITIAAWIQLPSNPQGGAYILSKAFGPDSYSLFISDTAVGFAVTLPVTGSTAGNTFDVNTPIDSNTWHHVAGRYDGHKVQLFVDGKLVESKQVVDQSLPAGELQDSKVLMKLGCGAEFSMDELALYGVALSDAQISELASGSNPHWPATTGNLPLTFDDLSKAGKVADLERRVKESPAFSYYLHNELSWHYNDLGDHRKGMEQVNIILQHVPMDTYMLSTLGDWNNDNPPAAINALLQNAEEYPDLLFVRACCWTRACELETDPDRASEFAVKVAALDGPEFDVYRKRTRAHVKTLHDSARSTSNPAEMQTGTPSAAMQKDNPSSAR